MEDPRYTIEVIIHDSVAGDAKASIQTSDLTSFDIVRWLFRTAQAAMIAASFHPDLVYEAWDELAEEIYERNK